jgi:chloramphenicol-sensitive protein RarD
MHRVVWSAVFVFAILASRRQWAWLGGRRRSAPTSAPRSPVLVAGMWRSFAASAVALSINWFVYVWAVNVGRVVDASLGYFINPLFTVGLGAVFLKEKLRRAQVLAVGLASMGVLWLVVQVGQVPWIGLTLATSFGIYGLLRKTAALGALEGLALETLLLSPFAAVYLAWLAAHGNSDFLNRGPRTQALVVLAGPVTTIPLLLFAAGARRIPLSLLGLLQYVAPTLQLLVGLFVLGEPFSATKLLGYAFIWLAFALASADGLSATRRTAVGRGV